MREVNVERALGQRIHQIGGECFKFVSPGVVGVPDRIIIVPGGEIFWTEVKSWTGRLSSMQERMHRRLRDLEQEVLVIRSLDQIDKHFPIER